MIDEKRKVSTDALETLGTIIDDKEKRDAIHLAVIPMVAQQNLQPGDHVDSSGCRCLPYGQSAIGIVDPFLKKRPDEINGFGVKSGEHFWLIIYPRQIHSLRHVWTHPSFPESIPDEDIDNPVEKSKKWLKEYINEINRTDGCPVKINYNELLEAANEWIYSRIQFDFEINTPDFHKDFWHHYEIATGKKVDEFHKKDFFNCCC